MLQEWIVIYLNPRSFSYLKAPLCGIKCYRDYFAINSATWFCRKKRGLAGNSFLESNFANEEEKKGPTSKPEILIQNGRKFFSVGSFWAKAQFCSLEIPGWWRVGNNLCFEEVLWISLEISECLLRNWA